MLGLPTLLVGTTVAENQIGEDEFIREDELVGEDELLEEDILEQEAGSGFYFGKEPFHPLWGSQGKFLF